MHKREAKEHLQVGDDHAGESGVEIAGLGDEREIREPAAIQVSHVHATVEHDPLTTHRDHDAALPHLLPRPYEATRSTLNQRKEEEKEKYRSKEPRVTIIT